LDHPVDRYRDCDVILLQETWLSDCIYTAVKLDYFFDTFTIFRSSSMEEKIKSGLLSGRWTPIWWHSHTDS